MTIERDVGRSNTASTPVRVFVSSPGDLRRERLLIVKVCRHLSRSMGVKIQPLLWEGGGTGNPDIEAFPPYVTGAGPQAAIDQRLWDEIGGCDIYVGMIWNRMGTPTNQWRSGTEAEYEGARLARRRTGRPSTILFYRKTAPADINNIHAEQAASVRQFAGELQSSGLLLDFSSLGALESHLVAHLTDAVRRATGTRPTQAFSKYVRQLDQQSEPSERTLIGKGLIRPGDAAGFVRGPKLLKWREVVAYARRFFDDEIRAREFMRFIEAPVGPLSNSNRSARYVHLAHDPLYLHMLCWLHAGRSEIEAPRFLQPASEDDLWHEVIVQMLAQQGTSEQNVEDSLRLLEELSFHHRFCAKELTQIYAENTAAWLAMEREFARPREKAQQWLAELELAGMLERQAGDKASTYGFAILGLDEYFAARHLAARWARDDVRYARWLPRSDGRWTRPRKLACPNPHCHEGLPSFRGLLRLVNHQEVLLLTVGLLDDPKREEMILKSIWHEPLPRSAPTSQALCRRGGAVSMKLRALARCRHRHPAVNQELADETGRHLRTVKLNDIALFDALSYIGKALDIENLQPILDVCFDLLEDELNDVQVSSMTALGYISVDAATERLLESLRDDQTWAAAALGFVGVGENSAQALIDQFAVGREDDLIAHRISCALGLAREAAVGPLVMALDHENPRISIGAIITLVFYMPSNLVIESVARAIGDQEDTTEWPFRVMQEIGNEEATFALRELSTHERRSVRRHALAALDQMSRQVDSEE